jgi:hypothetical protein
MRVNVNGAPYGGNCSANPTTGRALSTPILLRCQSWADKEGNYPLSYAFAVLRPSGAYIALSSALNVSSLQVGMA